jgi:lipopolysaccharide transport system ATP-binding protein
MPQPVIRLENVSKVYRLGEIGTGTISNDFSRWWSKTIKGVDPQAKIGQESTRANTEFWALKDVSFDIHQGDVLGIIGKNGAGKSTLLKILSRITSPTAGTVKIKGRIASLLEVGTGFHPELSGRDNVYLNGSFLGMKKWEIDKRFDEIIDFSGIEKFIDTPVKRYSSGMYVRLAFAVAAHLDPEILIIDEVLAVGDAEFQAKCLGKMQDVSQSQGRTVIFVSHSMGTIAQLCKKSILLKSGQIDAYGSTDKVIEKYNAGHSVQNGLFEAKSKETKDMFIKSVRLSNESNETLTEFFINQSVQIHLVLQINRPHPQARISVTLQGKNSEYLSTLVEPISDFQVNGSGEVQFTIAYPTNLIAPNKYALRIALFVPNGTVYDLEEMICPFTISDNGSKMSLFEGLDYGSFVMNYEIKK